MLRNFTTALLLLAVFVMAASVDARTMKDEADSLKPVYDRVRGEINVFACRANMVDKVGLPPEFVRLVKEKKPGFGASVTFRGAKVNIDSDGDILVFPIHLMLVAPDPEVKTVYGYHFEIDPCQKMLLDMGQPGEGVKEVVRRLMGTRDRLTRRDIEQLCKERTQR